MSASARHSAPRRPDGSGRGVRRAVRVEAMGGGGGAVGLFYWMMGRMAGARLRSCSAPVRPSASICPLMTNA